MLGGFSHFVLSTARFPIVFGVSLRFQRAVFCGFQGRCIELVVQVLFAGMGLFRMQTCGASGFLAFKRNSHEVDGFVAGVFEVAVGGM